MIEKRIRSMVKGVTWRLVATLTTVLVAWLVVGDAIVASLVGAIEVFTKFVLYYVHERIWSKIKFGRLDPDELEYQI